LFFTQPPLKFQIIYDKFLSTYLSHLKILLTSPTNHLDHAEAAEPAKQTQTQKDYDHHRQRLTQHANQREPPHSELAGESAGSIGW